jgi:hypothetical protein
MMLGNIPMHNAVSIHPYFKVHPGQLDAAKALQREFVAKTASETKMLHYGFTICGDQVFCREAYVDAQGVLDHLTNVGPLLERMLTMADLTRLELHGPAAELEKLKGPLGKLNPMWFACECAVQR